MQKRNRMPLSDPDVLQSEVGEFSKIHAYLCIFALNWAR
jgi:hypothetical protein